MNSTPSDPSCPGPEQFGSSIGALWDKEYLNTNTASTVTNGLLLCKQTNKQKQPSNISVKQKVDANSRRVQKALDSAVHPVPHEWEENDS